MQPQLNFAEAIRRTQATLLADHPEAFVIGEGVRDPKAIFGTTKGLPDGQLYESPVSENGIAGMCIGAALAGARPIMTFQRIDFSLYAADQIINNAAKWQTMLGRPCPVLFRMVVGRGWGQGIQHAQNLQALYAHIPGLTVYVPHDPESASRLFRDAFYEPGPSIFLEHKWLYGKCTNNTAIPAYMPDITIVSIGTAVSEAASAIEHLAQHGTRVQHLIIERLPYYLPDSMPCRTVLICDDSYGYCGIAAELMAQCHEAGLTAHRLSHPHDYASASPAQSRQYYFEAADIVDRVTAILSCDVPAFPRRVLPDVSPFSIGGGAI